jgi:hypothetical protein
MFASGMPDADELKFLGELTTWMDVNDEGIFASRPRNVYGEDPSVTTPGPRSRFGGGSDYRNYTLPGDPPSASAVTLKIQGVSPA